MSIFLLLAGFGALPFGIFLGWTARKRWERKREAMPAFLCNVDLNHT